MLYNSVYDYSHCYVNLISPQSPLIFPDLPRSPPISPNLPDYLLITAYLRLTYLLKWWRTYLLTTDYLLLHTYYLLAYLSGGGLTN